MTELFYKSNTFSHMSTVKQKTSPEIDVMIHDYNFCHNQHRFQKYQTVRYYSPPNIISCSDILNN